jgi:hypothetical protein
MRRFFAPVGVLWLALLTVVLLTGCTQSRAQKLAARADKVETALTRERDRVLELPAGPERSARLDHLSSLNLQLRAANISRVAAPRLLTGEQVDMAFDVLDEVYGTINWNIPLAPSDTRAKPLPDLFTGAGLDFNRFTAAPMTQPAPAQPPPAK